MNRVLLGAAVGLAALASGKLAFAEEPKAEEPKAEEHKAVTGEHAEHNGEHAKHGEHGEHHEHPPLHLYVDGVLGFSEVKVAVPQATNPTGPLSPFTTTRAKITSESFIFGLGYHLTEHFGLGIRVPLTVGQINAPGYDMSSASALGAIELEAEYERHLSRAAAFFGVLGISLPTGQGILLPEDPAVIGSVPNASVDKSNYDRGSLQHAAALARGSEEDALFQGRRFGINPKIGMDFKAAEGKFVTTVSVKMENLIGTATIPKICGKDAASSCDYQGSLVPMLRIGYRAHLGEHFGLEPAVKVWANVGFAGVPNGEDTVVVAVEPQIALHIHNIRPLIGVILPVAGPGKLGGEDPAVGLRLSLGGHF